MKITQIHIAPQQAHALIKPPAHIPYLQHWHTWLHWSNIWDDAICFMSHPNITQHFSIHCIIISCSPCHMNVWDNFLKLDSHPQYFSFKIRLLFEFCIVQNVKSVILLFDTENWILKIWIYHSKIMELITMIIDNLEQNHFIVNRCIDICCPRPPAFVGHLRNSLLLMTW